MIAKPTMASAVVVAVLAGPVVVAFGDPAPGEPADDPSDAEPVAPDSTVGTASADPTEPGELPPPPPDAPIPHPSGRFSIGAGFSPDDKFLATATIAQDDLFRTGTQLALSARISARGQMFLMRFADPTLLGSDVGLSVDLYNERKALPGFTREAAGGSMTLARSLSPHLRGFVGWRVEAVEVEPGDELAAARAIDPGIGAPPLGGGTLSALRAGLVYSNVDAVAWPHRGTSAGLMVEHADRRLGSDVGLDRVKGWLTHHQPIGPLTLHLGFDGEMVQSSDPLGLPRSERLYLDGSSDLRGYAPGSLGPVDGGTFKLGGHAELEVPVVPAAGLSLAGFVDVAGIGNGFSSAAMGHSYGFGIRWRSPIGPLSFDWAFPGDGGKPRFLFMIGSSF